MPPAKDLHMRVLEKLVRVFLRQLDEAQYHRLFSEVMDLVIRTSPLTCREPDVAVFERSGMVEKDGYYHSAPQLAVEILSPSENRRMTERKLRDYESIGTPEAWVITPEARTVEILLIAGRPPPHAPRILAEGILKPRGFPTSKSISRKSGPIDVSLLSYPASRRRHPAGGGRSRRADEKHRSRRTRSWSRTPPTPISSEQAFYQGAIPGLLRKLDPHSVFFDPGQFEQLKKMEASTQKGFGSVVSLLPGRVIVLQTLPGTPSAKAGTAARRRDPGGQRLRHRPARHRADHAAAVAIAAAAGAARRAAPRRFAAHPAIHPDAGGDAVAQRRPRVFHRRRDRLHPRLQLRREDRRRSSRQAIEKLGGDKLAGLVLDLRNNPGGMVTAALRRRRCSSARARRS